jgi:hypothetical protein
VVTAASYALKDGRMNLMRLPYPMGFFAKGLDGRIRATSRSSTARYATRASAFGRSRKAS